MDPATIANIQWIDSEGNVLCEGDFAACSSLEVDPDVFDTYTVTITDINGCTITDDILVREQLVRDVYIPTIFSPTEPTPNNVFRPLYDQFIEGASSFQIFDRWGELVFDADIDQLNIDPSYGWNGRWNNDGGDVEQGVYVYYIEIRYVDNGLGLPQEEIFVGDVTIIR